MVYLLWYKGEEGGSHLLFLTVRSCQVLKEPVVTPKSSLSKRLWVLELQMWRPSQEQEV